METSINKKVPVQAKTLSIYIKERSGFGAFLINQDGCGLAIYQDLLPNFIPFQPCSHCFMLAIDMNTGKITNWKKPTPQQIGNCLTYSKQPICQQAFELEKLKKKLCFLEEKIDWKRQEITTMQEEIEQLYKELKQGEGEAT